MNMVSMTQIDAPSPSELEQIVRTCFYTNISAVEKLRMSLVDSKVCQACVAAIRHLKDEQVSLEIALQNLGKSGPLRDATSSNLANLITGSESVKASSVDHQDPSRTQLSSPLQDGSRRDENGPTSFPAEEPEKTSLQPQCVAFSTVEMEGPQEVERLRDRLATNRRLQAEEMARCMKSVMDNWPLDLRVRTALSYYPRSIRFTEFIDAMATQGGLSEWHEQSEPIEIKPMV